MLWKHKFSQIQIFFFCISKTNRFYSHKLFIISYKNACGKTHSKSQTSISHIWYSKMYKNEIIICFWHKFDINSECALERLRSETYKEPQRLYIYIYFQFSWTIYLNMPHGKHFIERFLCGYDIDIDIHHQRKCIFEKKNYVREY